MTPRPDRKLTGRNLAAAQFAVSASALLVVVVTAGLFALHQVAQDEALRDATRLTRTVTDAIVAPRVDRGLLDGDPTSVARMDDALDDLAVREVVVRVKLWTPDGRILYSDEPALIGRRVQPTARLLEVARTGVAQAEVSDLDGEEHLFEQSGSERLLEVYVPVTLSDGTRLVAETYQPTSGLTEASHAIWRSFFPVLLIALVALGLAQVPLALWYGRRSRAQAAERLELMARAEQARQDERSRIAADLHDSVVQDLAGIAFDLVASAQAVHRRSPDELATTMLHAADVSRSSITQLRSLLLRLHPPQEEVTDLDAALLALAAELKGRGVKVDLTVEPVGVGEEERSLLQRAAQEAVRNVARHAAATRATISVTEKDGVATLLVEDDGQGMTTRDLARQRAAGHVGLTLLADRVRAQRGELTISSEPGRGTRLVVWLPVDARDEPPATPRPAPAAVRVAAPVD